MNNFLKKQREILTVFLYVVLISSIVYFLILPLNSKINSINDQIQQEKIDQESVKLHIDQLPKIQAQYNELQDEGGLDSALLDKEKVVVLIEKIEKLAENTSNKIEISLSERAPVATQTKKVIKKDVDSSAEDVIVDNLPSPDYLQMKITITGEYNSIVKFVALLEKFEYYADVTAIQLGLSDESTIITKNVSSNGMFGIPTPTPVENTQNNILPEINKLIATLDVVFYTN